MTKSFFWWAVAEVVMLPWAVVWMLTDGLFNDGIESIGVGLSCLMGGAYVIMLVFLRALIGSKRA